MRQKTLILSLLLSFSFPTRAECPTGRCSVSVTEGSTAPFDGVLMSTEVARDVLVKASTNEKLLEVEKQRCTMLLLNEKQRCDHLTAVEDERYKAAEKAWERLLATERARTQEVVKQDAADDYEKYLGAAVGFGLGIVATAGLAVYVYVVTPR